MESKISPTDVKFKQVLKSLGRERTAELSRDSESFQEFEQRAKEEYLDNE